MFFDDDSANPDIREAVRNASAVRKALKEQEAEIAARRAALGRALIEEISGLPAVMPPALPVADRGTFWFFYFRLRLDKLKCSRAEFVEALKAEYQGVLGGKVAGTTQQRAIAALLASLVMIVIYVWLRFQNLAFGLAAVVALVHDVVITVGLYTMAGSVLMLLAIVGLGLMFILARFLHERRIFLRV